MFQRPTKVHEPVERVHFVVFEKFRTAYLFQIAREKSCDYLYKAHALSQFVIITALCNTCRNL